MSAHCNRCGSDIVYPEGTWPLGTCARCDMEKRAEAAEAEVARLRDGLRLIEAMAGAAGSGETPAAPIATEARALLADQDGAA